GPLLHVRPVLVVLAPVGLLGGGVDGLGDGLAGQAAADRAGDDADRGPDRSADRAAHDGARHRALDRGHGGPESDATGRATGRRADSCAGRVRSFLTAERIAVLVFALAFRLLLDIAFAFVRRHEIAPWCQTRYP